MRKLNWVIAIVGVLTIIAPFVFNFTAMTAVFWSNIIVGILLIVFSLLALSYSNLRADQTFDWIAAVLGLWLLVSPFFLNLTAVPAALWSNVVLGVVGLIFGIWTAVSERQVTA